MPKSIFIGIGLLTLIAISSQAMVSNASIENNSSGSNESSPGKSIPDEHGFIRNHLPIPPDIVIASLEHINNAQTALQKGDNEGANNHLELAKQSLQSNQSEMGTNTNE